MPHFTVFLFFMINFFANSAIFGNSDIALVEKFIHGCQRLKIMLYIPERGVHFDDTRCDFSRRNGVATPSTHQGDQ